MPFIDLNQESIDPAREDFDVVIAGAGAAGILLAVTLSGKGKKVLLLESGHFEEAEDRQSLNRTEQTGKELTSAVWGRKRAIGGTTIAWGGQSLPFSPLDLAPRPWVANSGWPLEYTELTPYYPLANRFMDIDELDYDADILRLFNITKPAFDQDRVWYHFSKWAPEPNFRKLYEKKLAAGVTLVYNAVLTKIDLDGQGRVDVVTVNNFEGRAHRIPVQKLILATGGIETNRILLSNNHQLAAGIGGASGWLGKCFMEHPCIEIGTVATDNAYRLQRYFNTHMKGRRRYSIRMSLTENFQTASSLLNGSASLMFAYPDESMDPYQEIKDFIKKKSLLRVRNLAAHSGAYMQGARAYLFNKFLYKHGAQARLVMMLEQEPLKESFIGLSEKRDRFGASLARIHWQLSRKSWDCAIAFTDLLKAELHRLSFGQLNCHPYISPDNDQWDTYLSDVNHHMGGTRMSAASGDGVVNKHLQVWGHDNLFLCSSSVYPTGSHSNPTLTLLALALRLADRLVNADNKL